MIELRDFIEQDLEPLAQLANNANVNRYLTSRFPYPYTVQDAHWWLHTGSKAGITKVICWQQQFAGVVAVTPGQYEHTRCGEIGYWLGEPYWGKGIATNAVMDMTQHIFNTTELIRIYAPVFSPNLKSRRVLEKCGYTLEATLKKAIFKDDTLMDELIYAKLHPNVPGTH